MFVRSLRGSVSLVAIFGVAILGSAPAHAEDGGDIDLNSFHPAMDSRGYLTINASQVLGHKEFSFGLGALDWGYKLLKFGDHGTCNSDSGAPCYSVDNIISATLIGAFGLKAGPAELEFGVSVPMIIMSGDRGPNFVGATPNDNQAFKLSGQGIGNVGLHFKTRFLKTSRPPHVGIGVIASLYLDTTDPKHKWLGEGNVTPQVIGILDKEFGRTGALRISLNGGIRIRKSTTFTDNDVGTGAQPAPITNETVTAAAEIPFGLGIAYAIAKQKFDLVGEVYGALPMGDKTDNYGPLEALAGVKLYLARNSFLSLGGGPWPAAPARSASPDFRGVHRHRLRAEHRRPRRRRHQGRRRQVPGRSGGLRRLRGRGRLPRARQRSRRHPRRGRQVPEQARGQGRLPGRGRLPRGRQERSRRRRHPRRRRQVPGRPRGLRRVPGRGRLPRSRQRSGRHPRRRRPVPERSRGQGRLRGRGRLPRSRQRQGPHPRQGRQVPERAGDLQRLRGRGRLPGPRPRRRDRHRDRDPRHDLLRVRQGDHQVGVVPDPRRGRGDAAGQPEHLADRDPGPHRRARRRRLQPRPLGSPRRTPSRSTWSDKGVDAKRLSAQGYGETQPIDRSHNEAAWAKNRRVAFLILKRASD